MPFASCVFDWCFSPLLDFHLQDGWEILPRGESRWEDEDGREREWAKRRRTRTEGDKENTAPGR